jgi:hypothetical protein
MDAPTVEARLAATYPRNEQPPTVAETRQIGLGGTLPETATRLIDEAKKKQTLIARKKPAHPDEITDLQVTAQLALAQSNVELATALKALTDAAGKNNGTLKDAITTLTNKIAELAKK